MVDKNRTFNHLPVIIQTDALKNFWNSTAENLFSPSNIEKVSGYIGSKPEYYDPTTEFYINSQDEERNFYNLSPAAVTVNKNQEIINTAFYQDFTKYLKFQGGLTNNVPRLYESRHYSWCPPIDIDKLTNYFNYFWLPNGPAPVEITGSTDVESNILGKKYYTAPDGTEFTSGMKVIFRQNIDNDWNDNEYIVEGVGRGIILVPDDRTDKGWDIQPWDSRPWDQVNLNEVPEYFVIERGSNDGNPWSTGNRWFHRNVLTEGELSEELIKASRPIIEFVRDIEIYNYGSIRRQDVDILDTISEDVFSDIDGQPIPLERDGIELREGMRVLATNDQTASQNNRVYYIGIDQQSQIYDISLETDGQNNDGSPADGELVFVNFGFEYVNSPFYYDAVKNTWIEGQKKEELNQSPLFQLYDVDGVPLNDQGVYPGSDFEGSTVFNYTQSSSAPLDSVTGRKVRRNQFGEIVFENTLLTDAFTYTADDLPITGYYFVHRLPLNYQQEEYWNNWFPIDYTVRQYLVEEFNVDYRLQDTFTISQEPDPEVVGEPNNLIVQQNGRTLERGTEFTLTGREIKIASVTRNDLITIKTFTENPPDEVNGFYEIPLNLEANPTNDEPAIITQSEFFEHFTTIIGAQENLEGSAGGINNWRDTAQERKFGRSILQHDAPMLRAMILSQDERLDLLEAIRYNSTEFTRFRNKLIQKITGFYTRADYSNRSISDWLNNAITEINRGKTKDFPFYYTDVYERGSHIPPTPSYLGLYPVYKPEKYTDDTFFNPTPVIRGHDGSIYIQTGDIRDDVILEFENKIYNSIPSKFKDERLPFVYNDYVSGKFRNSFYSFNEFNKLLQPDFERWVISKGLNYKLNNTFDINNRFTWNFSGIPDVNGTTMPGSWKAVYRFYFDTIRPHTHPWEMLGFGEKPSWWEIEYGTPPYTSNTTLMWVDLENGEIRRGERQGIDETFARPGLSNFIPVDASGNLLDPVDAGIVSLSDVFSNQLNADWSFGEEGPVESIWRRSEEYTFTVASASYLMRPAEFVEYGWDPLRQEIAYENYPGGGQRYNLRTRDRQSPEDYIIHTEIDSDGSIFIGSGIQQWIVNQMRFRGLDASSILGDLFRGLTVRLAHKFGAFVNLDDAVISADNFGIVPKEDISIGLYQNRSIREEVYSGVIVEWNGSGYKVVGYDVLDPNFYIIPSDQGAQKFNVKVGETNVDYIKEPVDGEPVEMVPYGTVFKSRQEVFDFLISYSRYLENRGWVFDRLNEYGSETVDWLYIAKQFVWWSEARYQPGAFIALSPAAELAKFRTDHGYVNSLEQVINGVYALLNRSGRPIPQDQTYVSRFGNEVIVEPENTRRNGIFAQRLYVSEIEHIIIFANKTVFNDLVYDPLINLRQPRLKLFNIQKSQEWTGRYEAPGFIITDNTIVPNYETTVQDFTRYYQVEDPPSHITLQNHGRHLTGYEHREYLRNLLFDSNVSFEFYQGFMKNKGTLSSLDNLFRSEFVTETRNLNIYEEWAFRLSRFGATENEENIEFQLRQSDIRNQDQPIEFRRLNERVGDIPEDLVINIGPDSTRWIEKPENFEKPWPILEKDNLTPLPTAGYARIDEIKVANFTIEDIRDFTDIVDGDRIWIYGDTFNDWDIYRVFDTQVTITNILSDDRTGTVSLALKDPYKFNEGDYIFVPDETDSDPSLFGWHRITLKESDTQYRIDTEFTQDFVVLARVFALKSVRYYDLSEWMIQDPPPTGWTISDIFYIDNGTFAYDPDRFNVIFGTVNEPTVQQNADLYINDFPITLNYNPSRFDPGNNRFFFDVASAGDILNKTADSEIVNLLDVNPGEWTALFYEGDIEANIHWQPPLPWQPTSQGILDPLISLSNQIEVLDENGDSAAQGPTYTLQLPAEVNSQVILAHKLTLIANKKEGLFRTTHPDLSTNRLLRPRSEASGALRVDDTQSEPAKLGDSPRLGSSVTLKWSIVLPDSISNESNGAVDPSDEIFTDVDSDSRLRIIHNKLENILSKYAEYANIEFQFVNASYSQYFDNGNPLRFPGRDDGDIRFVFREVDGETTSIYPANYEFIKISNPPPIEIDDEVHVQNEIIGQPYYVASDEVIFYNGMRIMFKNPLDSRYKNITLLVEGVGSSINLVPDDFSDEITEITVQTDIEREITNRPYYTTSDGIVLKSGMRVIFRNDVSPELNDVVWIVQGVGDRISFIRDDLGYTGVVYIDIDSRFKTMETDVAIDRAQDALSEVLNIEGNTSQRFINGDYLEFVAGHQIGHVLGLDHLYESNEYPLIVREETDVENDIVGATDTVTVTAQSSVDERSAADYELTHGQLIQINNDVNETNDGLWFVKKLGPTDPIELVPYDYVNERTLMSPATSIAPFSSVYDFGNGVKLTSGDIAGLQELYGVKEKKSEEILESIQIQPIGHVSLQRQRIDVESISWSINSVLRDKKTPDGKSPIIEAIPELVTNNGETKTVLVLLNYLGGSLKIKGDVFKDSVGLPTFTEGGNNSSRWQVGQYARKRTIWKTGPPQIINMKQIREETDQIESRLFRNALIYDKKKQVIKRFLTLYDPVKGIIPGVAERELSYKLEFDPAKYTNGVYEENETEPDFAWGKDHWGELWMDLSTVRFLDYEIDDDGYRGQNWGTLLPGASIDIYEWVRSSVPPSEWNQAVETAGPNSQLTFEQPSGEIPGDADLWPYTVKEEFNPRIGRTEQKYYFWVLNKNSIPPVDSRKTSARDTAAIISNPSSAGISWFAPMSQTSMIISSIEQFLDDENTVVQMNYRNTFNDSLIQGQWTLIRPNDPRSVPDDLLWYKMRDSLAGFNFRLDDFIRDYNTEYNFEDYTYEQMEADFGVPDPNLQASERYGNFYRPRQSWFVDQQEARKVFFNCINTILERSCLTQNRDTWDNMLFYKSPEPSQVNFTVNTLTELYNLPTVQNVEIADTALVKANNDTLNRWTLWRYLPYGWDTSPWDDRPWDATLRPLDEQWKIEDIQLLNLEELWNFKNWFAEGFDIDDIPELNYPTFNIMAQAGPFEPGTLIEIDDDGTGKWARYVYTENDSFELVGSQDCTIEFNNLLWKQPRLTNRQKQIFDGEIPLKIQMLQNFELREIIETLRVDILTELERNEAFFCAVNHVHAEQDIVDWAFKTSFISITGIEELLEQTRLQPRDNLSFILDYIEEVKPYHVKIRNFLRTIVIPQDTANVKVTDFDKPPYVKNTGETYVLDPNNLTDADILENEEPWKFWWNNYQNNPELIRSFKVNLLFDRLTGTTTSNGQTFVNDPQHALDRIANYYFPSDDRPRRPDFEVLNGNLQINGIENLLRGQDYQGTSVEGYNFTEVEYSAGWDTNPWDTLPWDDEAAGGLQSSSEDILDSILQGGYINSPIEEEYSGDGVQTEFKVPVIPIDSSVVTVRVNNIVQTEGTDYTIEQIPPGSNDYYVVFATAPGDQLPINIEVRQTFTSANDGSGDIIVEGYRFQQPYVDSGHPGERVPSLVRDTMSMDVYTQGAPGAPVIASNRFVVQDINSEGPYKITQLPASVDSVQVHVNGKYVDSSNYSIDWFANTLTFNSNQIPNQYDYVKITSFSTGGGVSSQLYGGRIQNTFYEKGTGSKKTFDVKTQVTDTQIYVTVDGDPVPFTTNGTKVQLTTSPAAGTDIVITVFDNSTTTFSEMKTSAFVVGNDFTGNTLNLPTELQPEIIEPKHATTLVQLDPASTVNTDGYRLRPPFTEYLFSYGVQRFFALSRQIQDRNNIQVYVENTIQTQDIDFFVPGSLVGQLNIGQNESINDPQYTYQVNNPGGSAVIQVSIDNSVFLNYTIYDLDGDSVINVTDFINSWNQIPDFQNDEIIADSDGDSDNVLIESLRGKSVEIRNFDNTYEPLISILFGVSPLSTSIENQIRFASLNDPGVEVKVVYTGLDEQFTMPGKTTIEFNLAETALNNGDIVYVTTWSDDRTYGTQTEVFEGRSDGEYVLSQAPPDNDNIWVTLQDDKNVQLGGEKQYLMKDYSFGTQESGWDERGWDTGPLGLGYSSIQTKPKGQVSVNVGDILLFEIPGTTNVTLEITSTSGQTTVGLDRIIELVENSTDLQGKGIGIEYIDEPNTELSSYALLTYNDGDSVILTNNQGTVVQDIFGESTVSTVPSGWDIPEIRTSVAFAEGHEPEDRIIITTFGGQIEKPPIGFRIFTNSLMNYEDTGNWMYTSIDNRIGDAHKGILKTDIDESTDSFDVYVNYNVPEALIPNPLFNYPDKYNRVPGVVYINGERIEFWNLSGPNSDSTADYYTISQLVRGSLLTPDGVPSKYETSIYTSNGSQTVYEMPQSTSIYTWVKIVDNDGTETILSNTDYSINSSNVILNEAATAGNYVIITQLVKDVETDTVIHEAGLTVINGSASEQIPGGYRWQPTPFGYQRSGNQAVEFLSRSPGTRY